MPRGNKTGPRGMGPMTGRGAGYCAGFDQPGCANPAIGLGRGRGGRGPGMRRGAGGWLGLGLRRGWSGGFAEDATGAQPAPGDSRKQMLEQQLSTLKTRVGSIEKALSRLDDESEKTQ